MDDRRTTTDHRPPTTDPDAFHETEIGPIPADWELVSLGHLIDNDTIWVQTGFSCSNRNQNGYGLGHIRPMNVTDDGKITLEGLNFVEVGRDVSRYLLRRNDVIFNNTNSETLVGKTALWMSEGKYGLSNHMTILRIENNDLINPRYLASRLHKLWQDGYSKTICRRYVNQAGIGLERIRDIPIPLPPLPEQRRIAAVLTAIQDAIAAQEDVIAAARALKRSLMQRLFTYGPGCQPAETRETEIGEIPVGWAVVELGDVIAETQYGLNSRAELAGTYPVLRMNNLVDGRVDVSDLKYTELDEKNLERYRLQRGDVLFNRTNSYELVGKTAIFDLEDDYTFASYLVRVIPNSTALTPEFLNYCLNSDLTRPRLKSLATRGVSQSNISPTKLKRLVIGLPPIDEQNRAVSMIKSLDAKIAAEEDRKTALDALFRATLHQLMTGQMRLRSDEGLPLG